VNRGVEGSEQSRKQWKGYASSQTLRLAGGLETLAKSQRRIEPMDNVNIITKRASGKPRSIL
jgi:hypothetical protein